jgi:hypothetical protein
MTTVMLREAQLLVAYPSSPLTSTNGPGPGDPAPSGPGPGERAPDCRGLTTGLAVAPLRLYDLLRERGHVLVLYADSADALTACHEAAATTGRLTGDKVPAFVVAGRDAASVNAVHAPGGGNGRHLPVFQDGAGEFGRLYGARGASAFLIRPDGYLAARLERLAPAETEPALADALGRSFRL